MGGISGCGWDIAFGVVMGVVLVWGKISFPVGGGCDRHFRVLNFLSLHIFESNEKPFKNFNRHCIHKVMT